MKNTEKHGRARRLFAIWLSFAMVLSAIPASFFAVYADSAQSDPTTTASAIFAQDDTPPKELQSSDPKDLLPPSVFDNDPVLTSSDSGNKPFLLSEWNELFLYRRGGDQDNQAWIFTGEDNSGIDMTRTSLDSNGYSWVKSINVTNVEATEVDFSETGLDNYSFMAGTSFDPLGTGRKQYAAYVGWAESSSGGNIDVIIYNPVTGDYRSWLLGYADWVKKADPHYFEMQNVMAITSGDYDGDGKDSLIVFCCGDGNNLKLYEVTYNGSRVSDTAVFNIDANLVYKEYLDDATESAKYLMRHKPVVSLTTGDLDGDGIDEFAYSAGFYNGTNDARDGWNGEFGSSLRDFSTHVCVGDKSGGSWSMSEPVWLCDEDLYTTNSSGTKYHAYMMHAGVIAAGDTDGDGIDEIVAAGYTSVDDAWINYSSDGKVTVSHICDWNKTKYATALIEYSGSGYIRTTGSLGDSDNLLPLSSFAAASFDKYKDERFVLPKIAVECGHTNGQGQREDVFIAGEIYNFESGSGVAGKLFTPKLMTEHFGTIPDESPDSDVYWVSSVTAGNFDHNNNGREQFVYVVMFMESGSHKYNWSYLGVAGGCIYDDEYDGDELVSFGECTAYGGNPIRGDGKGHYVDGVGSRIFRSAHRRTTNAIPLCLDVNDDGILAKHNKNYYAYSDPDVKAVLQAAPYFGELNELGAHSPGSTSFTIETSYGKTKTSGWEVNFSGGIALEGKMKVVKASLEIGGCGSWSREYEKSYEITKSRTFTAAAKDVVVITRIPVLIYVYDIWDEKNDKWIEGGQMVTVPLSPAYYLLTVKEYNDFVDEYNAKLEGADVADEHKLIKITSNMLPEKTGGDPFAYWNDWTSAPDGIGTSLADNELTALGYTGGSSTVSWSSSTGSTNTYSHSKGLYFELTVQVGHDDGAGMEGWVGGSFSFEHSWLNGNSTSQTSTTGASGTVNDIDADALDPDVYSEEWCRAYSFTWDFGCWSCKLSEDSDAAEIPFYGYRIERKSLQAPAKPAVDFKAKAATDEEGDSVIRLTWKDGGNDKRPTGAFTLYLTQEDGSKKLIEIEAGDEDYITYDDNGNAVYEYIFRELDGRPSYEFFITTTGNGSATSTETVAPVYTYLYVTYKSILSVEKTGTSEDGLTDTYSINYTDGTSTEYEVRHGVGVKDIELVTAAEDSDDGLTSTYRISFTDGSSLTYEIKNGKDGADGKDGTDGKDGADGREIELRVDEESGYIQWRYTGDETWTDLLLTSEGDWLKGEKGDTGDAGADGADGREVEMKLDEDSKTVMWRYKAADGEDEEEWAELFDLS